MRWKEPFSKEGLALNTFTDKNSGKPFQVVTPAPFLGVIITIIISSNVIGAWAAVFCNNSICKEVIGQLAVIRQL